MNSKLDKINEYVIKTMEELDNTSTDDENLDNVVKKCIAMSTAGKTVIANYKLQIVAQNIKEIGLLNEK